MNKVVYVSVRNVYGVDKVYPECEQARVFASIAGTKTLSHQVMCAIEALGYTIMAVPWRTV